GGGVVDGVLGDADVVAGGGPADLGGGAVQRAGDGGAGRGGSLGVTRGAGVARVAVVAAAGEDHVGAVVEGLGAVGALPDQVDDVAARLVGQRGVPVVLRALGAAGTDRRVGDLVERDGLQVVPAQRAVGVPAVLGDVQVPGAGVRRPRVVLEGDGASGLQRGGGLVLADRVQPAELRVGAAQLAVGDDLAVPAAGVADQVAEPVVEGVVAVLREQVLAGGVGGREAAADAALDAVDV